jgi:hypothetical protein
MALGLICPETATPKRPGSREEMGGRTGTGITTTEAAVTGTAMTETVMTNAVDIDLAAPLLLRPLFLPRPSWIFFII